MFSSVICACARAGELARATRVYRDARAAGMIQTSLEDGGARRKRKASFVDGDGIAYDASRVIDLHGMRKSVACIAVTELLNGLRRARRRDSVCDAAASTEEAPSSDGCETGDLLIITGRGKGSIDRKAVLKPAVLALLSQPAYAALAVSETVGNPGSLTVTAASLGAWLSEGGGRVA
jgi:pentatricopeptide repeat protein